MIDNDRFRKAILQYKNDPESVYTTWFLNSAERLKAFRAIRRGVEQVVQEIQEGRFGSDFKGSSLETVLNSITEQKQVFEGAAHPFYWKPKLRIPDIYENEAHKKAFGQFLDSVLKTNGEENILRQIIQLDQRKIKGLGPAVANILYFLQPTLMPPFNTAIVRGYNQLFSQNEKLGSWGSYMKMREHILEANNKHKDILSNDLGAITGLIYDVGVGQVIVDGQAITNGDPIKLHVVKSRHQEILADVEEETAHTKVQYLLLKIGKALGYDVIPASNDRSKSFEDEKFSFISLSDLPDLGIKGDVLKTIDLIDVLWFEKGKNHIIGAFEIEKSTSIYSGILRLMDLGISFSDSKIMISLVAPDKREREILVQLARPSLLSGRPVEIGYILFSELYKHADSICCLGNDLSILRKITRRPSG